MSRCFNCNHFNKGFEDGQYYYCKLQHIEISRDEFRIHNGFPLCPEKDKCNCGNPEHGFNCSCKWTNENPGDNLYCCEFCGIYRASKPQCSECEGDDEQ